MQGNDGLDIVYFHASVTQFYVNREFNVVIDHLASHQQGFVSSRVTLSQRVVGGRCLMRTLHRTLTAAAETMAAVARHVSLKVDHRLESRLGSFISFSFLEAPQVINARLGNEGL